MTKITIKKVEHSPTFKDLSIGELFFLNPITDEAKTLWVKSNPSDAMIIYCSGSNEKLLGGSIGEFSPGDLVIPVKSMEIEI